MKKISIIVPCYNLAGFLAECLESIDRQKSNKIEYIFVNDGSTDNTEDILRQFVKGKTHCKLINQTNGGVSSARNAALEIAEGEYVYLLDGDDILTDEATEIMLRVVEEDNCDAVLSEAIILKRGQEKRRSMTLSPGIYSPTALFKNMKVFPTLPKLLYKLSIIKEQKLTFDNSIRYGEVYDFTIRFFCFAQKIRIVHELFFKYVVRESSVSHSPNYSRDLSIIDTYKKYNRVGLQFTSIPSFKLTAFKMVMAFSYNKYAELGLRNKETYECLERILMEKSIRALINDVSTTSKIASREWLLANYVRWCGLKGYKFLALLYKIKNK